jgi:hypothetical protein
MKVKLVLLVLATMGSAALIASAQDAVYSVKAVKAEEPQQGHVSGNVFVARQPELVKQPPGLMQPPGALPKGAYYNTTIYGAGHPAIWAMSVEDPGLSHQAEQLAQQLAAAKSDSDRDRIKNQLAGILAKQFDQRQKRHEEEIKQLEEQIRKLKELVNKRQENRGEIIGARLEQIVKESQGLGW